VTQYETAARCHVGTVRKVNEDAILAAPQAGLWAVADGMGGHMGGAHASRAVTEALARIGGGELSQRAAAVRQAIAAVNAELTDYGRRFDPPRTVGATVVVLLADGERFICVWAGDSRAYRLRDGGLTQLTRDHSLVQQLVESGLISSAQSENHPDGHIITRAVGADPQIELESIEGDWLPGDTFLLCSDGLSRVVSPTVLVMAMSAPELEPSAAHLIDTTLECGAPDNVSFLLVRAASGSRNATCST
jgi:serine/threonine protein phosphatase PrpC